jgi:precorrin-2 dehydrogenase/sirohydrochlorin ferrochelatase
MMMPLLLNLRNKKALVVGGGTVAARRIAKLLEDDLEVMAVSPDFSEGLKNLENDKFTRVQSVYQKAQLTGIDLVVAATNNRNLNQQIRMDCASLKIWCNRVDDPEDSDFIFPSVIRRGDLTLSVCTEGASPFLTKSIVKTLSQQFGEEYTEKTALLRLFREAVLASELTPDEKTKTLKALTGSSNEDLKKRLQSMGVSANELTEK